MAPEIIKRGKHTTSSDVYAFGVILWEIASRDHFFSEIPFQTEIEEKVLDGSNFFFHFFFYKIFFIFLIFFFCFFFFFFKKFFFFTGLSTTLPVISETLVDRPKSVTFVMMVLFSVK